MPDLTEDRERQIVPRLRNFEVAAHTCELGSLRPLDQNPFTEAMLKNTLDDWNQSPGLSVAADLVSVALTLGRPQVAQEAAKLILASAEPPPISRKLAAICLGLEKAPLDEGAGHVLEGSASFSRQDLYTQIHRIREQLVRYPRNPILWTNLARLYTSLGQRRQARRAVMAALDLAPENRFVLRSAARVLLHQGEGDFAHDLLAGAGNIRSDPWIMAAEIATAAAIKRTSENLKTAQRLVDADRFPLMHVTELASAVGTQEALHGNSRRARKLLRTSLEQPSENAIAQAAWLSRNVPGVNIIESGTTRSYEANAWLAMQVSNWNCSLDQARRWQFDQTFSSRPAITGSFVASRVDRHEEAVRFAELGLLSNPEDLMVRNNLAFSLGQLGKLAEARRVLEKLNPVSLNPSEQMFVSATSGLLAFRSNDARLGRQLYQQAIALAKDLRDARAIIARIYLAFEELRAGTLEAEKFRQEALAAARELNRPADVVLAERLKKFQVVTGGETEAVRDRPTGVGLLSRRR